MRKDVPPFKAAFTLIELLVVIAIIAILAGILLHAIARVKQEALKKRARMEVGQIVLAINTYHSAYSRYPVSSQALNAAVAAGEDFTYGDFNTGAASPTVLNVPAITYNANNAEVMAILMDWDAYPNGTPTLNRNHVMNTQQIKPLDARQSSNPAAGGIDPAGVYRDPWGFPYVITMDLNYDEKSRDAFYRDHNVSRENGSTGHYGLFNARDTTGNSDFFEFGGGVMVWSFGIDRSASKTAAANAAPNKDHVLSWN